LIFDPYPNTAVILHAQKGPGIAFESGPKS